MSRIRLRFGYYLPPIHIPFPHKPRIRANRLRRGELHRIEFAPVAITATKGRHAAVCPESCASRHQDATFNRAADVLFRKHWQTLECYPERVTGTRVWIASRKHRTCIVLD